MAKPDEILLKLEIQEIRSRERITNLRESLDKLDGRTREYKRTLKELQLEEQKLSTVRANRIERQNQLANSTKNLTKATLESSKATGGATASVLELGRVISDAPYGIRGMANNLSQLATSMAFTFKSAGSLVAGFKALWSALLGPLGVILAINTLLSLLESSAIAQNKNTDAVNEGTEAIKKQITPLQKLINLYNSLKSSLFSDNDSEALRQYKEGILTLDETVKIVTRNFSEFKGAYDKLSDAQKKDSNSVKALIDGYYELLELRKQEDSQVQRMAELREDISKNGEKIIKNGLTFTRAEVIELKNLEREYIKTQKRLIQLEDYFSKETEKTAKRLRVQPIIDLEMVDPDKIAKFNQKLLNAIAKSMGVDLKNTPIKIAPELDFELNEKTQEGIDAYNKLVVKMMGQKFDSEDFAQYADAAKKGLSIISDFIEAQFDRDLAIEQNKTTALNDELNQRLLNENLSKDERARIQQEIWQNDDKLRKKQNEIKKKAFNANKAFQISMAVADTASSALKAYGSQLVVGDPTSIVRAKVAAAIATATGLAQIATIAAQKFVPDSSSTPIRTGTGGAGGGGGLGDRSFNFNLVGANQQNQLLNAIQSQFDRPLKAYVVSKDVTNQQQLDANTRASARFGG